METLTKNNFFDGSITIYQPKEGYRFSIDPILLAAHLNPINGEKVLDIGTGSGIIPISIFYKNRDIDFQLTGVELQKSLYEVAKKNIYANNLENRIRIINSDILDITQKDLNGPQDIIVSNPPYQNYGSGRINPGSQKAIARHEIKINLQQLLKKVRSLLKNRGKFYIVYPANRASELIFQMQINDIAPKEIRFVHSFNNSNAVMVICQGISNGNFGVKILPPLIIYEKQDEYTKEVLDMIG